MTKSTTYNILCVSTKVTVVISLFAVIIPLSIAYEQIGRAGYRDSTPLATAKLSTAELTLKLKFEGGEGRRS